MRPNFRIILGLLFLAIILTASPLFASSASAPIPQADYWALVRQTHADLRALEEQPKDEVRLALDQLATSWSGVSEVELEDGTLVPVDVSFIRASLEAEPPDIETLDGLLEALLDAHESYPQNIYQLSDLDSLNAILLRPEFQWKPNPIGELLQTLYRRFMAWLLSRTPIEGVSQPFAVIAVIILILALLFVFRGLFTDLVKESNVDASAADDDRNLTSETAFRKAQNLSSQRDYRAAVRYLYLSSLLMMEERGILRYDRSRTNREYLRSVASHPNLAKPLRTVVDVFDRVWYGFEPLDESTYKQYVDKVEDLKEQKE